MYSFIESLALPPSKKMCVNRYGLDINPSITLYRSATSSRWSNFIKPFWLIFEIINRSTYQASQKL